MEILDALSLRKALSRGSELGREEFIWLYESQLARVFNYVRYRLGPDEAEDLTAEIFTRVWSRRHEYDAHRGAPETWLWAIARNAVTDHMRKRNAWFEGLERISAKGNDLLDLVSQRDELDRILSAMNLLSPVDQEIILPRDDARSLCCIEHAEQAFIPGERGSYPV